MTYCACTTKDQYDADLWPDANIIPPVPTTKAFANFAFLEDIFRFQRIEYPSIAKVKRPATVRFRAKAVRSRGSAIGSSLSHRVIGAIPEDTHRTTSRLVEGEMK